MFAESIAKNFDDAVLLMHLILNAIAENNGKMDELNGTVLFYKNYG